MSDDSVQVIIVKLEYLTNEMTEIKKELKSKCDTCVNAAIAKEKTSNQWYHITALWAAVVAVGGALWAHVAGK